MYRIIGGERGKWGKAAGFLIEVTTYETVVRIGGAGILLHLIMYIYTCKKQISKFYVILSLNISCIQTLEFAHFQQNINRYTTL